MFSTGVVVSFSIRHVQTEGKYHPNWKWKLPRSLSLGQKNNLFVWCGLYSSALINACFLSTITIMVTKRHFFQCEQTNVRILLAKDYDLLAFNTPKKLIVSRFKNKELWNIESAICFEIKSNWYCFHPFIDISIDSSWFFDELHGCWPPVPAVVQI